MTAAAPDWQLIDQFTFYTTVLVTDGVNVALAYKHRYPNGAYRWRTAAPYGRALDFDPKQWAPATLPTHAGKAKP